MCAQLASLEAEQRRLAQRVAAEHAACVELRLVLENARAELAATSGREAVGVRAPMHPLPVRGTTLQRRCAVGGFFWGRRLVRE